MRAWFVSALCVGLLSAGLQGCDSSVGPASGVQRLAFKNIDITGASYANALRLPDATGRVRDLAEFRGQVVVVFFGYTQCPDVCPTTLSELAALKQKLGPDGKRLRAVFVTVDPARDTPEVLRSYVSAFDPEFVALTGTPEQLRQAAADFKVYSAQVEGSTPTSYTIDHTAMAFVFDPEGRIRVAVRYGTPLDKVEHDVRLLLGAASSVK